MSILNLKWIKGAPPKLLPGMVVRVGPEQVVLMGSYADESEQTGILSRAIEHAQAISGYELDWLANMGLPAKAVA
jgi:hypothetical protein